MRKDTAVLLFLGSLALVPLTATPEQVEAAEPSALNLLRSAVVTGQGYFPVALRMQDRRIAVVLRGGGSHDGKGRLDIIFSGDEGKTWTKPTVVTQSADDDRDPAFGQAKDGTLIVGFLRRNNGHNYTTWVTRSADAKTWSAPAEIDVADIGWGGPYGRILTLPDSTLLMAVYGSAVLKPGEKSSGFEHSYLYRSADNGKTWNRFSLIGPNFNETALVRLSSGKLLAAMRSAGSPSTSRAAVSISDSGDEGRTWSNPKVVTPLDVVPADLVELPDGRVLMTVGDRQNPFGVRGLLSDAKANFDWKENFVLVKDCTSWDCGYPSSVVLQDGKVLTVYYATGSKDNLHWGLHCGALIYELPKP